MRKPFTFQRAHRLTHTVEFDRVRNQGTSYRGEFMTLGVLRAGDEHWRAAFITSRRVGNAVVRNRIRRRLREIARLHQHELAAGIWVVTIARATAARASYAALEREWLRLATKGGVMPAR